MKNDYSITREEIEELKSEIRLLKNKQAKKYKKTEIASIVYLLSLKVFLNNAYKILAEKEDEKSDAAQNMAKKSNP